jgi:hypothetical protein
MTTNENKTGPTEQTENTTHYLNRRTYLKLTGAAAVTGIGVSGTAAAAAYETITLAAGEDKTVSLGTGDTFEDTLVDASADGATFRIRASGSGWTIRNVGIRGPIPSSVSHLIAMRVDPSDGVGTIDNVYVDNVTNNFMFCNAHHNGHINVINSTFIYNLRDREDTLYGSPPGNPNADWPKTTGEGGTIRVANCYTERIGGYGWRMGSGGSEVVNCTLKNVNVALANLYGRTVTFRDVDVVDAHIGLRLGDHVNGDVDGLTKAPRTVVDNVRIDADTTIQRNDHNGNEPDLVGSVAGNPDPTPPAAAPMSAKEAASGGGGDGGGGDHVLEIKGGGSRTTYNFTVDSNLTGVGSLESGQDEITNQSASGVVVGGTDAYTFDGDLRAFDYDGGGFNVLLDGQPAHVGRRPDHFLEIKGGGTHTTYSFTVDSNLQGAGSLENSDEIHRTEITTQYQSASGAIGGGTDAYTFDGDLRAFDYDGGGFNVLLDGQPAHVGRRPDHLLEIQGSGTYTTYNFTVSRNLKSAGSLDNGDKITNNNQHASGAVGGGLDDYTFDGDLRAFEFNGGGINVLLDGQPARVGQLPNDV